MTGEAAEAGKNALNRSVTFRAATYGPDRAAR